LRDPDALVIRYGELALKGGNRRRYEQILRRNVAKALKPLGEVEVSVAHARILAYPKQRAMAMARRAAEVFGVTSVSPAYRVEANVEAICAQAGEVLDDYFARTIRGATLRFRVRVKRADKAFPMRSGELERVVADHVLIGKEGIEIDLREADLTLGIEVRGTENYVFLERLAGPGGLPVGTSGRGLCLLSGGIDSPVAAWLTMKRGMGVGFVSFDSFPYIGEGSMRKIEDLARRVTRFQGPAQWFVVPFTQIQEAIRDSCPERYRVVLYRRMMTRLASAIAQRAGYLALVTGESLGQVASQTIENIDLIGRAADRVILRPLITYDKEEAVTLARRIGTLELSSRPEPDCCTIFQPRAPVIFGQVEDCEFAESKLPMESLLRDALDRTRVQVLDPNE